MNWIFCGEDLYINPTHITHIRHTKQLHVVSMSPGLFEVFLVNGACIPVIWNSSNPQPYESIEKFLTEQTSS